MSFRKFTALTAVILFTVLFPISASILNSQNAGFSIDIPEGFELAEKNGSTSYLFEHTILPVDLIIRLYDESRFKNAEQTAENVMQSLNAEYDKDSIKWRNADCIILTFSFNLGGNIVSGWGLTAETKDTKGKKHFPVLLAYAPEEYATDSEQFLISCIDSFYTDRGSFYEAGPLTSYAFPPEGAEAHSIEIGGKKIDFKLDKSDIEADRFVVEREYAVLTIYQKSPDWQKAWQRYYRQIFRNECSRLKNASFAIENALLYNDESLISLAEEQRNELLLKSLLSWVQQFPYKRNTSASDFEPVTSVISGAGSDCDSRAMLLAALMANMNCKPCIFVSQEYSHAVFGLKINMKGAKIRLEGTDYLLSETTARVNPGLIAKDMNDTNKWIGVELILQ